MSVLLNLFSDVSVAIVSEWLTAPNCSVVSFFTDWMLQSTFATIVNLDCALTNKAHRPMFLQLLDHPTCLFSGVPVEVYESKVVEWMLLRRIKVRSISIDNFSPDARDSLVHAISFQHSYLEKLSVSLNSEEMLELLLDVMGGCDKLKSFCVTGDSNEEILWTANTMQLFDRLNARSLVHLRFVRCRLDDAFVMDIGARFPGLTSFELVDCFVVPDESVVTGNAFSKLIKLDISSWMYNSYCSSRVLEYITRNAVNLVEICIGEADAGPALVHCRRLEDCCCSFDEHENVLGFMQYCSLTKLELVDCHLTDGDMRVLSKSGANLLEFGIGRTDFQAQTFSLAVLAETLRFMPKLTSLALFLREVSDVVLESAAKHLRNLEIFQSFYGYSQSSDLMVALITANPRLSRFTSGPAVTDDVLFALSNLKMTKVELRHSPEITDDAVITLLEKCPNLEFLATMKATLLTDRVMATLIALGSSAEVYLDVTGMTVGGVSQLGDPRCLLSKVVLKGVTVGSAMEECVLDLQRRLKKGRIEFQL